MVYIYLDGELIKTHLLSKNSRHTDYSDFPENMQMAITEGLPAFYIKEAGRIIGKDFQELVTLILQEHCFRNLRRAQGLLRVAKIYKSKVVEEASYIALTELSQCYPNDLKRIIISLQNKETTSSAINISEHTLKFIRSGNYFNNNIE